MTEPNEKPVKVGDIIVHHKDGSESKVLEVFENTFVMSCWDDFDMAGDVYSFSEIESEDWTIKVQSEEKSKWLKQGQDNGWIEGNKIK